MPTTIDECYESAARTGKWMQALIMTCAMDESGEVIKPGDKYDCDNLNYKLHALRPYKNADPLVKAVIEKIEANIKQLASGEGP